VTQRRWVGLLALTAALTGCGTVETAGSASPETTTATPPPPASYVLSPLVTPSPTTPTTTLAPPPPTTTVVAAPPSPPRPPTSPPTAPPPTAADPAGTVGAFFAAINARDYRRAWDLGGRNLAASYEVFAKGFANTAHVDVIIAGSSGTTVNAQLHATNSDGSKQNFNGSYTVVHGVVTAGSQVPVP